MTLKTVADIAAILNPILWVLVLIRIIKRSK